MLFQDYIKDFLPFVTALLQSLVRCCLPLVILMVILLSSCNMMMTNLATCKEVDNSITTIALLHYFHCDTTSVPGVTWISGLAPASRRLSTTPLWPR